jgi:hypothetical protein
MVGDCGSKRGIVTAAGRARARFGLSLPLHSPPWNKTVSDRNATRERGEALARILTSGPAWRMPKPTVFFGAVEYSELAYGAAGRPFGRPPPAFVMHANRASLALDPSTSVPRRLRYPLAVCCQLAGPLLTQRPMDRDSCPQLRIGGSASRATMRSYR